MANEEATAVNTEVEEQESTATAAATEENNTPEVAESTENTESNENNEDSHAEETTEDNKPLKGAEKRKEQLKEEISELESQVESKPEDKSQKSENMEIRDLVARRNELKRRVEQTNSQVYRPATEDELLDQINPETGTYYSRLEAKLAAMEQQQQIERYTNEVAEAQLTLSSEAQRALDEFPMFDEQSPEYNKEVAGMVDNILGNSLVFDQQTGQVIGSHISPYQLYKTVAQSMQTGAVAGELKAQKATQQMLATADSTGSSQQGETPFEKLSTAEMAEKLRRQGHDI